MKHLPVLFFCFINLASFSQTKSSYNDGEAVMTAQIFLDKTENGIELFSHNDATTFLNVNVAK